MFISILIGLAIYLSISPSNRARPESESKKYTEDISVSELIDALRMCLQSGMSMNSSFMLFTECGITSSIIRQATANIAVSLPALHSIKNENRELGADLLIPILERGVHTGSSMDASLQVLATQLRAQVHSQKVKRIRAVAVKSVIPLGLCFLPAFIFVGVIPIAASLGSSIFG
jgi:pilus assembly protein TadC